MRILFLTDNFPPESNAPANRTWEHVRVWVARGHDVTVITTAPNFPRGKVFDGYRNAWRSVERREGVRIVRVKSYIAANEGMAKRAADFMSFMISATFFGLFERRPDVIVATSPQFFTACAGWMLSVLRWRPWAFEVRDLWPEAITEVGAMKRDNPLIRILSRIEMFLYRRAQLIVAVTRGIRDSIRSRGLADDKIVLITNGANTDRFKARPPDAELAAELGTTGKTVFGYFGSHGVSHALDTVIDAAELLTDREDIFFLFAGDGTERARLEQRAAGLKTVRFLGLQPLERLPDLLALCDAALSPVQNAEIFRGALPSKNFEAMAMGLPVILAAPEGEGTAFISDQEIGLCVPAEDPGAMAEAIVRLADTPGLRRRLSETAVEVSGRYDRSHLAEVMLERLQAVVGR